MMSFAIFLFVVLAAGADSTTLEGLLRTTPADSLAAPLRRFENVRGGSPEGAQVALMLGRLHYARGEYRAAAGAFARAAARLQPARKGEARYWAGLSWLALSEAERARAALEEVATSSSSRRFDARLGLSQAWELSGRFDLAMTELDVLLSEDPGEAGATALAMQRELALRLHRDADARRASERLLRDYPRSMEALRLDRLVDTPSSAQGALAVRIGAFSDAARAQTLAAAALRAGFTQVLVLSPTGAGAPLHVVQLGPFADPDEARRQAEQAATSLGVTPELVQAP